MKSKETIVKLMEQLKFDLQMELEYRPEYKSEIKRLRDRIAILGWVISE